MIALRLLTVLAFVVLASCARDEQREDASTTRGGPGDTPNSVYVVNEPLRYFAARIGGEHVDVVFPTPNDIDPAHWSPPAETVAAYQQATLILLNGAGYARWLGYASFPRTTLVDTSASFGDRLIPLTGTLTHTHGPDGAHAHTGFASTTWLDPQLAMEQARAVADALAAITPEHEPGIRLRFDALAADLQALDARLVAAVDRLGPQPVVFSHPVYQYFARRYGLDGRAVHWEPDEVPSPAMWRAFAEQQDAHPARWMIWEGAPLVAVAERLEALGVRTVVYEPGANTSADADFLGVMRQNVERLEASWSNR